MPLYTPDFYRDQAQSLLRQGESLQAYDLAREGLKLFGDPRPEGRRYQPIVDGLDYSEILVRLRQLCGLALARSGAPEEASRWLCALSDEGHRDGETLGILARTHKDLAELAETPEARQARLAEAHTFYREAYDKAQASGDVASACYTGINAATIAFLLGDEARARRLAGTVRKLCVERESLDSPEDDRYWVLATLGEASLLIGEWKEAHSWYRQAAREGRGRFGDLCSTRRQVWRLLELIGPDHREILDYFRIPRVVVFSGPSLTSPAQAARMKRTLLRFLQEQDARVGYASAGTATELLFWEAMRQLEGEIRVVLPYEREQFMSDRLATAAEAGWQPRFEDVLRGAVEVVTISRSCPAPGSVSQQYSMLLLHGLAGIRAQQLGVDLLPLAVWSPENEGQGSETGIIVRQWRELGLSVRYIDPASPETIRVLKPEARPAPAPEDVADRSDRFFGTQVKAILFADAIGYSKLTELQIPLFVEHFLGLIGRLADAAPEPPILRNTWGDGLYFVFSDVRSAGRFALGMQDRITAVDWAAVGLPASTSLRIALHAGPVYVCTDPVTGSLNFTGTHVSSTARIEPVTPGGKVYASQAFAALAAVARIEEFACDYVGRTELAKQYGTMPLYHVRRRVPRPTGQT